MLSVKRIQFEKHIPRYSEDKMINNDKLMTTNQTVKPVNILSPQFKANPFPFFAQLRAEAPVYRMLLPDKKPLWIISRYEDVNLLMKDERFIKNPKSASTAGQMAKPFWMPSVLIALERNMLDLDAPDHTRLRGLVHKAFTPRLIEQMRDRVQSLSDELLDKVERKGKMDLMKDYALPVPLTIITEILGIPSKDHEKFHKWSSVVVSASSSSGSEILRVLPSMWSFVRYLQNFIKMRRADLKDDLVSALIQAESEGNKLTDDELLAMVFILLIAGHETTVNLIGNGTLELLRHPEQLEMLRSDPSLIKSAAEELVRYTAPVLLATERYAREDVTMHGVTIPRGELVLCALGSANRDANVFTNPDVLDITRENNKHMAFGQGVHYCVGAPLARLEGQIAINTLLRRLPNLRLGVKPESLQWRSSLVLRGLEKLPVTF
jgi:cytochrome P450